MRNIYDVIKEEQIKLGYRKEVIRLYYPLQSLNRFFDSSCDVKEMCDLLGEFAESVKDELGTIDVSVKGERFCLRFPEETSEYIHQHTEQSGFLYDFIAAISKHHVSIDEILDQFKKYSNEVHFEKMDHGEFDYLIYFENGDPDEYRYCLTDEGCHMIYHRFTADDYNDAYGAQ